MSAVAHHTQTSDRQPFSTSKTKIVDSALCVNEIRENHIANAGIPDAEVGITPARRRADAHRAMIAERKIAKEERKRKRRQPVKKPWSEERKAKAKAARAAKFVAADAAVCTLPVYREKLGLPDPTPEQKELVWLDYLKWDREWKAEWKARCKAIDVANGDPVEEDETLPWAQNSKYNRDRAANGFVNGRDDKACGKYDVGAFEEDGIRSEAGLDSDPLFYAMATSTPKAGRRRPVPHGGDDYQRLRAGPTKSERPIQWGKLQALDQDYIDTLESQWTWICIDLDQDFSSDDELREHIRAKVRVGRLACEPHFVVCALGDGDELLHPHLWWKLPDGLEVYNDCRNPNCRNAPRRLYNGVATGICVELEDFGADAGHLGNPRGGKTPNCPRLHTFVWNVDIFPTLEQWSRHVSIWHRRDHVVREQVIRDADGEAHMSNQIFTEAVPAAWQMLHDASNRGFAIDDIRERGVKLLADLHAKYAGRQFGAKVKAEQVDAVLRSVAKYVSEEWTPWSTGPQANRGVAYDLVRGIPCRDSDGVSIPKGVSKRQSVGGKVGPAIKLAKTLDMMITSMEHLAAVGLPFTLDNVGMYVDRSPRCVKNNFARALEMFQSGSDPTVFSCLIGGNGITGDTIEPLRYTDLRQRPAGIITPTSIRFWPGGFEDRTPQGIVKTSTAVDPCCPATEVAQHGSAAEPAAPAVTPPCPASADTAAGGCETVTSVGDGPGVQRSIPTAAGDIRYPGSQADGRVDYAGGHGGRDDCGASGGDGRSVECSARQREAHPETGVRVAEVAGRRRETANLHQHRHPEEVVEGRGWHGAVRKATYADRRSGDLTLAEDGTTLLVPVVSFLSHDRPAASGGGANRQPTPPWLLRRNTGGCSPMMSVVERTVGSSKLEVVV